MPINSYIESQLKYLYIISPVASFIPCYLNIILLQKSPSYSCKILCYKYTSISNIQSIQAQCTMHSFFYFYNQLLKRMHAVNFEYHNYYYKYISDDIY